MRLGIATHEGRVSPVLDVAQRLLVVGIDGGTPTTRREVSLAARSLNGRAQEIQAAGINVLICGALSCPLEAALAAAGVRVIAQVCGHIDDVLEAYLAGRLRQATFLMPGCSGRRRHPGGRGDGRRGAASGRVRHSGRRL